MFFFQDFPSFPETAGPFRFKTFQVQDALEQLPEFFLIIYNENGDQCLIILFKSNPIDDFEKLLFARQKTGILLILGQTLTQQLLAPIHLVYNPWYCPAFRAGLFFPGEIHFQTGEVKAGL